MNYIAHLFYLEGAQEPALGLCKNAGSVDLGYVGACVFTFVISSQMMLIILHMDDTFYAKLAEAQISVVLLSLGT